MRKAKCITCRGGVPKQIGITIVIDKLAGLRFWTRRDRGRIQLPICGKAAASRDRSRKSGAPPREPRPLPAAQEGIYPSVRTRSKIPSTTKRQIVHPVGVELMGGIEIGHGTELVGRPRIDDLVELIKGFKLINALSIGPYVQRFRERVIEIPLETVSHSMTQHQLQTVV